MILNLEVVAIRRGDAWRGSGAGTGGHTIGTGRTLGLELAAIHYVIRGDNRMDSGAAAGGYT